MHKDHNRTSASYDEILYLSSAFPASSPDNLSVIARLAGVNAAPVESCRVLEIGCAAGRNLTPLAQALPNSSFLGIDISSRQIERAIDVAQQVKLTNIEFRCQNILEFNDAERFDYVIVHGIYSWVPRDVRDKIMQICRDSLSDSGIAYISYNTYPGWYPKKITRDLMRFHARDHKTGPERLAAAREILNLVVAVQSKNKSSYANLIRELAPELASGADYFLAHDDLEEDCEPVYFLDFVQHAHAHGLRYIGAAEPSMNLAGNIPLNLRNALEVSCKSVLDLEQYADFINGTRYRASILCKAWASISSPNGVHAIPSLHVAAMVIEGSETQSLMKAGEIRFYNPLTKAAATTSDQTMIAAMRKLANVWPHAIFFDSLLGSLRATNVKVTADTLAHALLSAYILGLTEFWTRSTDFLSTALENPRTTPLARLQAEIGDPIISLRHHEYAPVNDFTKQVISLLDGKRDYAAIRTEMLASLKQREVVTINQQKASSVEGNLDQVLKQTLTLFAVNSLLVDR